MIQGLTVLYALVKPRILTFDESRSSKSWRRLGLGDRMSSRGRDASQASSLEKEEETGGSALRLSAQRKETYIVKSVDVVVLNEAANRQAVVAVVGLVQTRRLIWIETHGEEVRVDLLLHDEVDLKQEEHGASVAAFWTARGSAEKGESGERHGRPSDVGQLEDERWSSSDTKCCLCRTRPRRECPLPGPAVTWRAST